MVSIRFVVAASAALVGQALAQNTIQILAVQDLTLDDTFVFKPNEITAEVGDILEFHFAPTAFIASNHSVAQGTFEQACTPMDGGFFSGNVTAMPGSDLGEADVVFQVEVTSTEPMVFYCTAGQHCTRGMYGVVNPSDSQNRASYKATIPTYGPAVAPSSVTGGKLVANRGAIDLAKIAAGGASPKASMAGLAGALAFALLMC